MNRSKGSASTIASLFVAAFVGCLGLTGCASECDSDSLPSPYYCESIEYFPPGPEFRLSREAAAQKRRQNIVAAQGGTKL